MARVWDEALLDAIRRDVPAPTVHARNLFHTSAAMWDAWAAYEPDADGYFVDEKHEADDVEAAREVAISYAAYRVLLHRYSLAAGLQATFDELAATMESLCYRIDFTSTEGDSPAALGNRIAQAVIEGGRDDGSLEERRYIDSEYRPVNPPMVVAEPGAQMRDPNRWQPLALAQLVAQNGLPIPGSVQRFVGPHWGHVEAFALPGSGEDGLPIDPGPPPLLGDDPASEDAFKQAAVEVLRASSYLDPGDGATIDIGPGASGDSSLGTNDGDGYEVNPETGEPYAPNEVLRGDFARVLAEFWADGPESETPPGHWNTIANEVSDTPDLELRIGGDGAVVDRLEWDVKLYFALNGAVHDAAVAAWGVKGYYDSVRPISMIRYLGGKGQSSDPAGPAYHPDGLPLVDGLVEVVSPESSAAGPAARGPGRPRGRGRGQGVERQPRRPLGDQWRGLDPRRRLGPLPAVDVRDPCVRRLRVRSQHVQPGGRRGDGGVHRRRLLPRRHLALDGRRRRAGRRGRSEPRRHPPVGYLLRCRRPGRHLAASSAASTSPRTTSRGARSGPSAAATRGRWRSATSPATRPPEVCTSSSTRSRSQEVDDLGQGAGSCAKKACPPS